MHAGEWAFVACPRIVHSGSVVAAIVGSIGLVVVALESCSHHVHWAWLEVLAQEALRKRPRVKLRHRRHRLRSRC